MKIVLASSSTYRQSILKKLQVPFTACKPDIDESALHGENIETLVVRLATEKAQVVANHFIHDQRYIIGSDQLARLDDKILGKPGDFAAAKKQLFAASGKTVRFYTGLCVINSASKEMHSMLDTYDVTFKTLSEKQINTYLTLEKPYDCAGSFKSEGLGIALFESLNGRDPNSLIGLPLIGLIECFAQFSIDLFDYMQD